MGKIDGKTVRTQIDSGARISMVWSELIPTLPDDCQKQTIVSICGTKLTLPLVTIQVELLGKMRDISAVVYEKCPVDTLAGRNCPEFQSVLKEAENMHQINVVTTRQQASLHGHGEEDQELIDLIGAEYDFPQTKLSQQTETADQQEKSNHSELVKDQRADSSLQRLLDQAKDPDSEFEFVIENEVLQRKTRDNHGNPYTQIVLPENRREEENDLKHSDPPDHHPSAKTDEISTDPELSENKKQELEDLVRKLQPDAG